MYSRVLCVALLLTSESMRAQSSTSRSPTNNARGEVVAAERALEAALIKMDRNALDKLYAEDLESRHWSGSRDTKASWLRFIVDSITYRQHSPHIEHVEIYPNAVWVSGTMISVAKLRGPANFDAESLAFGHLWVKDGDRWRLREQVGRKVERATGKP